MNKVICDICGTAYSDSQENCPVCGCSRDFGLEDLSNELFADGASVVMEAGSRKKNREIFDFDEVNRVSDPEDDLEEDDFDDADDYEEESQSNVGLVVILVILIILLLVTAGFFFLRYFLPNMMSKAPETTAPVVTELAEPETTVPLETGVPCTDIVLPGGKVEVKVGGMFLMNVQTFPQDTTDVLVYSSEDESIAVVSQEGTVTGVAEGQTVIHITCGNTAVKCNITVNNAVEEETKPTGELPAMEVVETDSDATDSTEPEATADATEPEKETETAEETTAATIPEGEVLKLKKVDITMFSPYSSTTLELDCAIPATEIKWFTMDSTVAIVHDGVVTATGSGITRIYGEYKDQQVQCIVRCNF